MVLHPLMRFRPSRTLGSIQEEMNRLFNDFFNRSSDDLDIFDGSNWAPKVDVVETKDDVIVSVEIPGIKQEDLHISITDNLLTLKGEKKKENEVKEENYHRIERSWGSFQRSITLPNFVNGDKAKAQYKDGILTITLPKIEEVKPKEIKINVS